MRRGGIHMRHKTAIKRNKLSSPMNYLKDKIQGRTLDYGCGRGDDASFLGIEKYDIYYFPDMPCGKFDTITCNYVLNVIDDENERKAVVENIRSLLNKGGIAYISVRNDKKSLQGWTSKGTWQGYVELDEEVVRKTGNYVMYSIRGQ